MPAGVTWGRYLRFTTAAMLSMFAGSQTIHMMYRPLDDMDELIEKERKRLLWKGPRADISYILDNGH